MSHKTITFGSYIANTRKSKSLNQKELANKLGISPQYLNDIEHDKRTPSSADIIDQIALHLGVKSEYLSYLAGRIPEEINLKKLDEESFQKAWIAFRRELDEKKSKK
jgi:transcriptional regulator with XRE-family HTH domain